MTAVSKRYIGARRALLGGVRPRARVNFLSALDLSSSLFSFATTGHRTMVDSSGYLTYAPNNALTNSDSIGATGWTLDSGGAGVNPVVTQNYAANQTGTGTTASRLQLNKGAGVGFSRIQHALAVPQTRSVASIWMRSTDGASSYTVGLRNDAGSTTATVTGTWQQFYVKNTTGAPTAGIQVLLWDVLSTSQTADILVSTAVLASVTYETAPRPDDQVITTSAAYYGPRLKSSDPTTLQRNGLQLEGAATNTVAYSQNFADANWLNNAITKTSTTIDAPDGTSTAGRISFTAGNSYLYQNPSARLGTITGSVTFSVWLRGTGTMEIGIYDGSTWSGALVTLTGTWTRWSVSKTLAAASVAQIIMGDSAGISVGSITATSFDCWGAQLETGSSATSYIPTGATSVTRPAETLASAGALTTALAAGRSIVEWTDIATGVTSRQDFAAGGFSFATGKFYRYLAVYPPGVSSAYTGAHLVVGGPF